MKAKLSTNAKQILSDKNARRALMNYVLSRESSAKVTTGTKTFVIKSK